MLHRVFFSGCSDLIYHISAVWQQTRLAHLVPAPAWTTGWYSASCNLRWFESEPSCGPGTRPSSRPKSARPAANQGQEMKSQMLLNKILLELEDEAELTNRISPNPKTWSSTTAELLLGLYRNRATPPTISSTHRYLTSGYFFFSNVTPRIITEMSQYMPVR